MHDTISKSRRIYEEKVKFMLFGAFIFYVIGVVTLIIYNGTNYKVSFYIKPDSLQEQKLIDYYEKTNYKGNVRYKEYYKQLEDPNYNTLTSYYRK